MSSSSESEAEKKQKKKEALDDIRKKKEKKEEKRKLEKVVKKRAKNSSDSSSGEDGDAEPQKKKKTDVPADMTIMKGDDGELLYELGALKFASVSKFKGKVFVNIREYYNDKNDGKMKPGKKGICLTPEQFKTLIVLGNTLSTDLKNAETN